MHNSYIYRLSVNGDTQSLYNPMKKDIISGFSEGFEALSREGTICPALPRWISKIGESILT